MGIWIRSQKGFSLVNIDGFDIEEPIACNQRDYRIIGSQKGGSGAEYRNYWLLGTYPTEAEAKAVLDQIQRHIGEVEYGRYGGRPSDIIHPVFEMPPAGFSKEGE